MSAVRFAQYSTILFGLYNISLTNGSQCDEFIQKFFFVFVRFDILFSRPPAGIKKPRRRRLRRGFFVNRHEEFRLCVRWDCSYFAERLSLPERERPPRVLLLCIGTGLEIRLPFASFTTGRTCSGRRQSLLPS